MDTPSERPTIGSRRLSLTMIRKTEGDKLVSQHSLERWFSSEEAISEAVVSIVKAFTQAAAELPVDVEPHGGRRSGDVAP